MVKDFTLLVIDDENSIHDLFADTICNSKYANKIELLSAFNGETGLKLLQKQSVNISFIDINLPNISGISLLEKIKPLNLSSEMIMISGNSSIETAVEAIKLGAKDFLVKPFDFLYLKDHIEQFFANCKTHPNKTFTKPPFLLSLVGESESMIHLFQQIKKIALADVSVLIRGESGTGKELVAKAIHDSSCGVDKPFIAINCGAIPRDLLESELFGHEKGAFTGAIAKKKGCFEQAQGGTLFLDEIGDLDLDLQVKLLRVLQDKEIQPLGGSKKIKVDIRIISATHRNLEDYMEKQLFREDLFFRLNVFPIYISPLRERKEDIPILVTYLLNEIHKKYGGTIKTLSTSAMNQFINYSWKGNIRELKNLIERLVLTVDEDEIEHIPENMFQFKNYNPNKSHSSNIDSLALVDQSEIHSLADVERITINKTLKLFNFNILKTAEALKIGRDTLYRKIKLYNINNPASSNYKKESPKIY